MAPNDNYPRLGESVTSVSLVIGMPMTGTGVVNPPDGFNSLFPFGEKPLLEACSVTEKENGGRLAVDKTRWKHHTAGPQSSEAPTSKGTLPHTLYRPAIISGRKELNMSLSSKRWRSWNNSRKR